MAKAQFKLLIFLITVGLFAGVVASGYWVYENILLREHRVEQDLAAMKDKERPRIDPGERPFDAAVDLIRGGNLTEGREALYKLLQQFPESGSCQEARRIIGEINMDQLFSREHMAGKKEYIVQPGESLNRIAQKNGTNVDFIIRLNGLMSTVLQPGDRLTVAPIEFNLGVVVSKKQVLLNRKIGDKEYLFKQYNALDVRLPRGANLPGAYEVGLKFAQIGGKTVRSEDPLYTEAEKWIPATKPGVVFRTQPVAKAIPVNETPPPATDAGVSPVPAVQPPEETGIFLTRADLEELFALIRKGAKLELAR